MKQLSASEFRRDMKAVSDRVNKGGVRIFERSVSFFRGATFGQHTAPQDQAENYSRTGCRTRSFASVGKAALCQSCRTDDLSEDMLHHDRTGCSNRLSIQARQFGAFSVEVNDAINALANSNLLYEAQLGRMTAMRTGPEFESTRQKFSEELRPYLGKVTKVVDLFSRIKNTSQAEEVTTFTYPYLQKKFLRQLVIKGAIF